MKSHQIAFFFFFNENWISILFFMFFLLSRSLFYFILFFPPRKTSCSFQRVFVGSYWGLANYEKKIESARLCMCTPPPFFFGAFTRVGIEILCRHRPVAFSFLTLECRRSALDVDSESTWPTWRRSLGRLATERSSSMTMETSS